MKAKTGTSNAPHKHLHSRISYLYQVALYLSQLQFSPRYRSEEGLNTLTSNDLPTESSMVQSPVTDTAVLFPHALTRTPHVQTSQRNSLHCDNSANLYTVRHTLSHLRRVSHKSQIRLPRGMKRSICRRCEAALIPGFTCKAYIENKSRKGKKPWADVLIVTCDACDFSKRFPVGAKRQASCEDKGHTQLPSA